MVWHSFMSGGWSLDVDSMLTFNPFQEHQDSSSLGCLQKVFRHPNRASGKARPLQMDALGVFMFPLKSSP